MKSSTKKTATILGILIILICMFGWMTLSLRQGNISLDGLKQPSTSKGVSYTPLEPTSFSHFGLKEPTFSERKYPLAGKKELLPIVLNLFVGVLFIVVMIYVLWTCFQMYLDIHYRDPEDWKFFKKIQKPTGESK